MKKIFAFLLVLLLLAASFGTAYSDDLDVVKPLDMKASYHHECIGGRTEKTL